MNKNLLTILETFKNLTVAGEVDEIKVITNINVTNANDEIIITGLGLDEEENDIENDRFVLKTCNIAKLIDNNLGEFLHRVDITTKDNKTIILETF